MTKLSRNIKILLLSMDLKTYTLRVYARYTLEYLIFYLTLNSKYYTIIYVSQGISKCLPLYIPRNQPQDPCASRKSFKTEEIVGI